MSLLDLRPDVVDAEMNDIAVRLETSGHVFTEVSAMACFLLGIRTLVGYGIKLPALVNTMILATKASIAESAAARKAATGLVDGQGNPL